MKFTNELKPPLEDALEHYGVLGMQKKEWSNSQRQSAKILKELNDNVVRKDNEMIDLYKLEKKAAVADGYIKKDASEEEFMKLLGWSEDMFKEK